MSTQDKAMVSGSVVGIPILSAMHSGFCFKLVWFPYSNISTSKDFKVAYLEA